MRDGDAVKGVIANGSHIRSLIDPDGTLRVVKYTADEINGFQAEVIRNGVPSLHGVVRVKISNPHYEMNENAKMTIKRIKITDHHMRTKSPTMTVRSILIINHTVTLPDIKRKAASG
ncbi:Larval cuticle protein A3A [Eumeta japonica]|uniref:Larval cuticle protein A3A n=1 Tax=Eumeta variegata TaxID=151549 RepID=A0A4C1SYF0_EUMVA|nr:Larval cuticle protein A3A [Eumeta japonica]